MSSSKILVSWEYQDIKDIEGDFLSLPITELEKWFLNGEFIKHLFKYRQSVLYTYRNELINRPFVKSLAIWVLSRGPSFIKDSFDNTERITIPLLLKFFIQHLKEVCIKPYIHHLTRREVRLLMRRNISNLSERILDLSSSPVYLRTDNCIGLNAGGSVTHTSGVLNNLSKFTGKVI